TARMRRPSKRTSVLDVDAGGQDMGLSSITALPPTTCWCTRGRPQPLLCSIAGHSGKASAKAWESFRTGACLGGPLSGLDEDEQMEEEGVTALCRYSRTAPSLPEPKSVYFAKKGLGKGKGMGALPEGPLPPTPATPKSYASGTSLLWAHHHRRLVAFSLWSTRPKGQLRRRLALPWTILVMCRRALCGLQSWGRVGVIFIRRVAQDILHWAHRRGHMSRIHLANRDNPCFMDLQEAHPEPQGDLPPLSPATGDHRPLFTFQDFLRNPSLGQHYGGNEGPPRPGRAALPCIYPAPLRLLPLAETYAEADQAQNVMGRWAMQILGNGPAVPPDEGSGNAGKRATHWYCKRCSYGVPITRTICTMCNRDREQCVVSDDEEPEDDVVLNKEELEEVARLERECADLEQRMRGLNAGQQRALLENLANSSSAVMGGLLADTIRRTAQLRGQKGKGGSSNVKVRASNDTARNDPKYLADLEAGVSTAVAFQRHRSRLRAVQHQVAQGNVALQPRATPLQRVRALPPMMSLGRSHRLYLLNRLERLERRGVTWTQEEQFLDYLEARVNADAERAEPTTASKSAGAPPPPGVPPHTGTTASTPSGTSSAPSGTTADGRPEPPPPRSDQPEDREAGRPVPPDQGDDQPGAQPSAPSTTPEGGDAAGDTAPAGNDLPADDSAQSSAVDGFHL
ncbi:GLT8D1, partial [Symbiodinium sp. CCMP2592]